MKKKTRGNIYICTVCGYEYRQENGDPENGVKEGTAFAKLPKNWICPVCMVKKEWFRKK